VTVHVLDTGAVVVLLRKHKPRILSVLKTEDEKGCPIWIPAPVLIEVGQDKAPEKKRLARVYEFANVQELDGRIAGIAGDLPSSAKRDKCLTCGGFEGPSLVDAVVMAFADDWASAETVVVHTQDVDHLERLNTHARVEIRRVEI
jgi:hypothetical protein